MRECEAQDLLGVIGSVLNGVHVVEPSSCFHVSPYTDRLRNNLVKHFEPTLFDWMIERHRFLIIEL
jgi:hypothetical protein